MKNFKLLAVFALLFLGSLVSVNAQSKVKDCQKAVDNHYESISDKKNSSVTPSASNRDIWKENDKDSCKTPSSRRKDGQLKKYSVANSSRKDKKKD